MLKSEAINELATALAKAQGQIKPALKDSSNPFFKSNYADLASVWDACRKPLSDNGLSIIQTLNEGCLETTLLHSSGQYITSTLKITPKDETSQAIGSAITYARRYALSAMVGVCADEDDDGEASMGRSKVKPVAKTTPQATPAVAPTTKESIAPPAKPQPIKKGITKETGEAIATWGLNPSFGTPNEKMRTKIKEYMATNFKRLKIADLTEAEGKQLLEALKTGEITKPLTTEEMPF